MRTAVAYTHGLLYKHIHVRVVECVLRLTCFCREWCEWYGIDVYVMYVCFDGLCVVLITAGLRLFFNCITTCVSTCDACAPHVIHLLAISCNSLVLYHLVASSMMTKRTGSVAKDITVEPWRWWPLRFKRPYHSQYNVIICMWCLFPVILFFHAIPVEDVFFHDRIASLRKIKNLFDALTIAAPIRITIIVW